MKKLVLVLLIVTIAAGGVFAQTKVYKVGVSMPSATHGWMANANWWAQRAQSDWQARDKSVQIELKFSGTVTQQVSDIEDLLVKKVDALVVFPHDTSVTSIVEKAYNSGVYVVVLDRGVSKEGIYDIYITNDDEAYTRNGMEWLAKQMGYKGNLLLITGAPSPIDTIRTGTIKEVVKKYPNIKLLDVQPGDWNKQKSLSVMENYLQKYKQVDAVYTADDDMMLGAMQAYKESGRKDIKFFLGGGCLKSVIKEIMDDSNPLVKADVTYSPSVIATSISYAVIGVKGDKLNPFVYQVRALPRRVILPSELVTKANAKDFYVPEAPF
ncbi:MAG: ribose ABC transporter substrate-binding protein [Spirochaetae bacterium HGW-Spirochaetae-7]|jgi:ribose transport system substrate-binding protein|nr:MAG: ribose ABC transporter substrate-binding protein [Spirochaetae bacterium HGW-Spirochaetae-7]